MTNRASPSAVADQVNALLDHIATARRWDGATGTPDRVAEHALRVVPVPDQYREVVGLTLLLIGMVTADLPEHEQHQLGNCLGLLAERVLRGAR